MEVTLMGDIMSQIELMVKMIAEIVIGGCIGLFLLHLVYIILRMRINGN
jgi:hypothetical protein